MDTDARVKLVQELSRRCNGLSQHALGAMVGRSQPAVRDWLIGKSLPDHDSIRRIVAAFPELARYAVDVVLPRTESGS